METKNNKTEYEIDNVTYIVSSIVSDTAKSKPCDIIKRMFLNELEEKLESRINKLDLSLV